MKRNRREERRPEAGVGMTRLLCCACVVVVEGKKESRECVTVEPKYKV
jgi:hypothetical protein